jgi:hypothetical protein
VKITKASVLTGQGPDRIFLTTDLPPPFPAYGDPLMIQFECMAGTGIEYVRVNFDLDPEVIQRSRGHSIPYSDRSLEQRSKEQK